MYHPRFKGNHREIGLKYGGLLKKNNIDLFGLTNLDDFQFDYGIQSERVLRKCFPEACDEIRGIAEGNPLRRKFKEDLRFNKIFIYHS